MRCIASHKVFISYRRDEVDAGRLYDNLESRLGRRAVFRDVDDADKLDGQLFADVLGKAIAESRALVIIIGPKWIDQIGRLRDSEDYVRMEIVSAIEHKNIRILPVLTGGVSMPAADQLPDDIKVLASIGAISFNTVNWKQSRKRLLKQIPKNWPKAAAFLTAPFAAIGASVFGVLEWMCLAPLDLFSQCGGESIEDWLRRE